MNYSNNDKLQLEKNVNESSQLLRWYESFKSKTLPNVVEYFETCDANDRFFVGELIMSANCLEAELQQMCDKTTWQFMPLNQWNTINSGIHQRIKSIKERYTKISPKILAHQESSGLSMQ